MSMKSNAGKYSCVDFGGSGPMIHFSHANGFHPESYRELFDLLTPDYRVVASLMRPLWDPAVPESQVTSWHIFADDLIDFLDNTQQEKVLGVGHSMGAVVTLLAAIKRPDLFTSVVLIEPVFLLPNILLLFRILPLFLQKKVPIIQKSLSRPDNWANQNEAFEFHRQKRVFAGLSDDVLWSYIRSGTVKNAEDGVCLRYSKQWEAHCYLTLPDPWSLISEPQVPVIGIRGATSDVLSSRAWKYWKKIAPNHHLFEVEGTSHLLPLENSVAVTRVLSQSLSPGHIIRS